MQHAVGRRGPVHEGENEGQLKSKCSLFIEDSYACFLDDYWMHTLKSTVQRDSIADDGEAVGSYFSQHQLTFL